MKILQSFTPQQVLTLFMASVLFVAGLIYLLRHLLRLRTATILKETAQQGATGASKNRTKYAGVDVFRYRGLFALTGLALVLFLLLSLFNLTLQKIERDFSYSGEIFLEDITVIPRTAEPPVEIPPLPSKIEEVPEELLLDEDQPELIDYSIEAETHVEAPVHQERKVNLLQPPPPPPPKDEGEPEIFKIVEQMPRFPGCEDIQGGNDIKKQCADKKLLEFVYENIEYPSVARESNVQGSVVASFVVNTDGTIEKVTIMRDIGAGCGAEVQRILALMNERGIKWEPGRQRGKAVKVQFILPVKFVLAP